MPLRLIPWEEIINIEVPTKVHWVHCKGGKPAPCTHNYARPAAVQVLDPDKCHMVSNQFNMPGICLDEGMYKSHDGYWLPFTDDDRETNEGEKICIFCSCPTEKRRDFNTFKVRDMCPRCKK
jgi:hypothetical protein